MPMSYAFSRLIFHLYPFTQDDLKKSYSLKSFHQISIYLNPIFKGTSTKNSIDFMIYALERLHNERINLINK